MLQCGSCNSLVTDLQFGRLKLFAGTVNEQVSAASAWSTIGRGQDPPPGLQSIASVTKGIYSRVLKDFEQVPIYFVPL